MITLALALAGTGPLSNVTLGMSPSDDTFATCVAQAATTSVDRTGYGVQQGGGTPLNLGTIDVGACGD